MSSEAGVLDTSCLRMIVVHTGILPRCMADKMSNAELCSVVQRAFRRPLGWERWHVSNRRSEVLQPALRGLGMLDEVLPQKGSSYRGVLLHGCTVGGFRRRVAFLLDRVWPLLLSFGESPPPTVYILTGQRPLDPTHNDDSVEGAKNEAQAMQIVWDQAVSASVMECPPRVVEVVSVASVRPNTADTVRLWMSLCPPSGRYLAVSSNPFVGYQHAATLAVLGSSSSSTTYSIDTVGPRSVTSRVDVQLDALAARLSLLANN